MADRMLFIGWGEVVKGGEERALSVFDESVGFYGRCQQAGRIERFEVVLLESHAGRLNGYIELHGTPQQLAALRDDDEFLRLLTDASMIVHDLRVVGGFAEQGVARQLERYRDAAAKLPQMA